MEHQFFKSVENISFLRKHNKRQSVQYFVQNLWHLNFFSFTDTDKMAPIPESATTTLRPNSTDYVYDYVPLEMVDVPAYNDSGMTQGDINWADEVMRLVNSISLP